MTVIHITALEPNKLGGLEDYILCFAEKMYLAGHKTVFVFGGEPHPDIEEKLNQYKVQYYVEKAPRNIFGYISMLYRLIRIIKKSGGDIIQGQFHPHNHLAVFAGSITGKPSYRTIHSTTSQFPPLKFSSIIRAKISSYLSNLTFAVSNAVKKDLIFNLRITEKKIRVLHNGVNLQRYCPRENDYSLHNELGIDKNSKIITCIAHARPTKGLNYLVNAVPSVIREHHNTHFVFCGGGPLESNMIDLAEKLETSANVHFIGLRDDVKALLGCSYLFVLPSLAEAFGLVLIESMAMKKAVVASDIGGISEIVQNEQTGLLVPPKDSESLSRAIISLLDDPDKTDRLGTQGRLRVEEHFDLNKRVEEEINIYQQELQRER